jgi:NADH dehydrogenase/NADH:ubiquinone oxidoreductase subunit G
MKFEGLGHGLSADLLAAANAIVLESGDYKKFFQSALKKFGVTSPAELKGDKEKEFYDYIDKNWKGKDEKKEAIEVKLPETVEIEETETFNEKAGKYAKYSDLLMQKAKLVAQGPVATKEVGDINKKIKAEIKKLGIKEDKGFEKILMGAFGEGIEEKAKPSKKFIKLGDEKKNLKTPVTEASRDYYKQVDALIAKHGNEKPFIYKAPKLNKILSDLTKLMKKEKEFPDSQKYGKLIQGHLKKCEVMGYEENIVLTNRMHEKFVKDFQGDTMFREDMAEIIMQDAILSYAIFGE